MVSARRNPNQIKEGSIVVDIILYAIAFIICLITLYPFYFVIVITSYSIHYTKLYEISCF